MLPALLIGGGTGFAPLKSIIRHILEKGAAPPALYWGARTAADLYEDALVRNGRRAFEFQLHAVLSDRGRDIWTGRSRLRASSGLCDYPDLGAVR